MSRQDLNPALKRRIKRLEAKTGRTCREVGVRVNPEGIEYMYGLFTAGRDRAVFTIGHWVEGIGQYVPAS
jgi:hypothetical protein